MISSSHDKALVSTFTSEPPAPCHAIVLDLVSVITVPIYSAAIALLEIRNKLFLGNLSNENIVLHTYVS